MKILKSVLNEELSRLRMLNNNYEKLISRLIRGSLIKKNIKGNIYYYLNYRQGDKSIFEYLGKLSSKERKALLDEIKERRKLEKLKRQTVEDIKKLEKMIK